MKHRVKQCFTLTITVNYTSKYKFYCFLFVRCKIEKTRLNHMQNKYRWKNRKTSTL